MYNLSSDVSDLPCPYVASVPNDNKFWITNLLSGNLEQAGDCGRGGLFNQSLCTCIVTGKHDKYVSHHITGTLVILCSAISI